MQLEVEVEVGVTTVDLEGRIVMVAVTVGLAEEALGMFPMKSSVAQHPQKGFLCSLVIRPWSSMDLLT
jgi:hypothetical protein